jgi:uncharacterized protein YdbL (DUF1318 family)
MSKWLIFLLAVSFTAFIPGTSSQADDESTLKQRFQRRYPTLLRLKNVGKIGESSTGFSDTVDKKYLPEKVDDAPESPTIEAFLGAENSDRKKLYIQIARKSSSNPGEVAKRNAKRVFEKALPHHFLKLPSGKWVQKKDLKAKSAH